MVVKLSEMALSMMALVVYVACATVQGNNFPPVRGRFPIPSTAVKRPLVDQGLLLPTNQGLTGYPTQRWIFPPNVILSQVVDDPSSEAPNQVSESDLPRQVGPVATPAPDGLPETDIADLPPEISIPQSDDRTGYVSYPVLPGKSQRPDGGPPQPLSIYEIFRWNPIDFPVGFLGQTGTDGTSNQTPPPPPPPPTTPAPLPFTDPPTTDPTSTNPIWFSPSGLTYPQSIQISNIPIAQVTQNSKPAKVIPIEPVLPSPIKGYAVSDIIRPPRKQQNIISYGSLNNFPRANFAQPPGLSYITANNPYNNGYLATVNAYNPPPPDRVRSNPGSDTVTLSNAYGDLWVLKRDGPRPYFERIKLPLPASALPYGTVSSSSSPKTDLFVIKKDPKVSRLIPQKTNVAPLNIVAPIPAASVSQPCTNKPAPILPRNPAAAPVRAFQVSSKGNPYPGPITALSPYSYITWNPKSRAYMYAVPAAKPTPSAAVVAAPAPVKAKVVKSVPRLVNLNGYWRPITLPDESVFNAAPVNPSRILAAQLQATAETQYPPQSSIESTVDYSSETSSTLSSLSTSLPASEPISDDSSSSEPLKLESLISSVTAIKEETPISRSAESDSSEASKQMESVVSAKPDPGRYRSYVFRYDYQNDPEKPTDRFARIIPVALRNSNFDSAGGDPFKFHKAVSYIFSEGDLEGAVTQVVPPSPESASPSEELATTGVDAQPSSSEESSNVVRVEETVR